MNQPTPAIVAQNAVRRLPRIALLLLCAAYLLPGLVGRGPWKSADITAFGYMAELARSTEGIARWFDPLLLGMQPETPALVRMRLSVTLSEKASISYLSPGFKPEGTRSPRYRKKGLASIPVIPSRIPASKVALLSL